MYCDHKDTIQHFLPPIRKLMSSPPTTGSPLYCCCLSHCPPSQLCKICWQCQWILLLMRPNSVLQFLAMSPRHYFCWSFILPQPGRPCFSWIQGLVQRRLLQGLDHVPHVDWLNWLACSKLYYYQPDYKDTKFYWTRILEKYRLDHVLDNVPVLHHFLYSPYLWERRPSTARWSRWYWS